MKYSIKKMGMAALFLITASLLLADDSPSSAPNNRQEVVARFQRLRLELTNVLTNHLITADQFNTESAKLDQLKIQEHADALQTDGTLSNDQRSMYNDLLSQIQRDIEQMEAAPPLSANTTVVPTTIPAQDGDGKPGKVYERFQALRAELTDDLNNHLITPDQFNTELAKLNQLKIQEHADASQNLLKDQQAPYTDQLNQIQRDIDQMIQAH